jgi:phospholipase A1
MKRKLFTCIVLLASFVQADTLKNGRLYDVINTEDIRDTKAKESIGSWAEEKFGLTPYRPNYILPFGYTSYNYKEYTPTDGEYKNVEVELQISFKVALKKNLFGLNEVIYGAYTQESFWQLYIESSPFRESNYNPELFVVFPLGSKEYFGLKSFEFGYSHLSNGQGNITKVEGGEQYPEFENRSRSINKLYAKLTFQQESFIYSVSAWTRVGNLDDNPDIMDYYGYMDAEVMYFYKKNLFTLAGRLNPATLKGAAELTYSYPGALDGVYFFAKIFTGYGESLIDYDNYLTKYSFGFSFSR